MQNMTSGHDKRLQRLLDNAQSLQLVDAQCNVQHHWLPLVQPLQKDR
jgi:hypothetical protein